VVECVKEAGGLARKSNIGKPRTDTWPEVADEQMNDQIWFKGSTPLNNLVGGVKTEGR